MKDRKLKAATFADDQFPWKDIATDDYICEIGNYCLRVEKMDDRLWWFNVSIDGNDVILDRNMTSSKYRAIGLCEGLYFGYNAPTGFFCSYCGSAKERKLLSDADSPLVCKNVGCLMS